MSTLLGKIIADFTTSLATGMAVGATSVTLQSATDDDNITLPAGHYFFAIDGDNAQKEHISCDLSGTSLTNIKSLSRQGVETSGCVRTHRVGSSITLTDFAHIKYINDLVSGATNLNASVPLGYDGTATISTANQLATKAYVDGVAIAGGADASTTVKGISKLSVAPVSPTAPIAVGDNDARLPTAAQVGYIPTSAQKDGLAATTTPATTNLFVTQKDFQKGAEKYAADAGSNDTYAITLSPALASYTAGSVFCFKANTVNTGPATLNINSVGALNILRVDGSALANGDIAAGQFVQVVIVDGSNCRMISPLANAPKFAAGTDSSWTMATGSGNLVLAHGLGRTPRFVRITAFTPSSSYTGGGQAVCVATYDGTTQAGSISFTASGASPHTQNATVTCDATNITLAFTRGGTNGTDQITILWEAIA
jgi:hypothetical protein